MTFDFLDEIARPFRALAHRRNKRRHAALTPAAERFAPMRPAPDPAGLSDGDRKYLEHVTRLAARRSERTHQLGRDLADGLRQGSRSLADAQLCAVVMHLLFFTARTRTEARRDGRDPAETYEAVLGVLACAAVDLAAFELEPAP